MNKRNILKWIISVVAIATIVFIIINSFFDGKTSSVISGAITPGGSGSGSSSDKQTTIASIVRKLVGHFCLFGFSSVMTTWALYLFAKGTKFNYYTYFGSISLGIGLGLSWLSELIQVFVPGRSGSAADVLLNFLGYFIGVLLVILILFLAKKPIFQKPNQEEK